MTPMMIADRGECSFVTKVRYMEQAGAGVGIVVDSSEEEIQRTVMSDDGSGAGIRIPSMLISKSDGIKLIKFLENAQEEELSQMAIQTYFDISKPDNRVEYDIWFSSSNDKALDFIQKFGKVDAKMGEQVLMTPHYIFQSCSEPCDETYKKENCLADGKYCGFYYSDTTLKGVDIV